jgi:LysM repeat protein
MEYCCTCATDLSSPSLTTKGKAPWENRKLDCCGRVICGRCIHDNERFAIYCPYCQISSIPLSLPQGLKDPPSYSSSVSRTAAASDAPPAYTESHTTAAQIKSSRNNNSSSSADDEKAALAVEDQASQVEDTLHFLNHEHDTIPSLSLRYGVPAGALRAANSLTSDHLLLARRTVLIPKEYYKGGVSLSPRPVEGEEEELRKAKIRRFMTSCKVSDYDVAVLYLEQSKFDLEAAVEAYFADEDWENKNQLNKRAPQTKNGQSYRNRGPLWRGL